MEMREEEIISSLEQQGFRPRHTWVRSIIGNGLGTVEHVRQSMLDSNFENSAVAGPAVVVSPLYIFEEVRVFQVNEVVDISATPEKRKQELTNACPTLKVLMTDGGPPTIGVVLEPIEGLIVGSTGIKLEICSGSVRRYGVLMMRPNNVRVLGGSCREMTDARDFFRENRPNVSERVSSLLDSLSPRLRFSPEMEIMFSRGHGNNGGAPRIQEIEELDDDEAAPPSAPSGILEVRDLLSGRPFPPLIRVRGNVFCSYELTIVENCYHMSCEIVGSASQATIQVDVKPSLLKVIIGVDEQQWDLFGTDWQRDSVQYLTTVLERLGPTLFLIDKGTPRQGELRFCLTTDSHERDPQTVS
jgi:hypothetical protein